MGVKCTSRWTIQDTKYAAQNWWGLRLVHLARVRRTGCNNEGKFERVHRVCALAGDFFGPSAGAGAGVAGT